jgi:biotin transporter BioY
MLLTILLASISGFVIFPIYIYVLGLLKERIKNTDKKAKFELLKLAVTAITLILVSVFPIETILNFNSNSAAREHQITIYMISLIMFLVVSICVLIKTKYICIKYN